MRFFPLCPSPPRTWHKKPQIQVDSSRRQRKANKGSQEAFQLYNAQGNTLHIGTYDFGNVGAKEIVVAMMTNGTVTCYQRPGLMVDSSADNRLWSFHSPAFAVQLDTARPDKSGPFCSKST